MRQAKEAPRRRADQAAPITYGVAMAILALRDGVASDGQQKMALQWIIGEACQRMHFPYHDNDRDTAFALGRRFVADQITGVFYMDIEGLRKE